MGLDGRGRHGPGELRVSATVYRENGALSVIAVTTATGASEATSRAQKLLTSEVTKAEILYDGTLINTVYKTDGVILLWARKEKVSPSLSIVR
jgi:hypothetical protein